jgi:orotidine-5'-phosphate decarboxylase
LSAYREHTGFDKKYKIRLDNSGRHNSQINTKIRTERKPHMRDILFRQMLAKRQAEAKTLLCVGLDPLEEKLPAHVGMSISKDWEKVLEHMAKIVDATAEHACMFKPQRAHYEAITNGEEALRQLIGYIHSNYPDTPVFLDCKRGDIDRTQKQYAKAHFELDDVDGINFNPYMGKDCMLSLVDPKYPGRALVGVCYTSNPGARQIQDLVLGTFDGAPVALWEQIAEFIVQWARESDLPGVLENAGLVMAAAYKKKGAIYSEHLKKCREIVGDKLWFLIPGVGTQGGYAEETVNASFCGFGSIAVNSSSGIIFASQGNDFEERAAEEAKKLKEQLWSAIPEKYLLAV